jgi:hypothetical protein
MGSYLRYINTRKQDDLATLILTGYQVIRMNELIVTGTYDNTRDNMCNILLLVVYTTDTLTGDNTEVCTNTQQSYRHVCKANEYIDSYGVDRALLTRMSMISGGDIISGIKLYLHTHTHIRPANEGDTHIHSHR